MPSRLPRTVILTTLGILPGLAARAETPDSPWVFISDVKVTEGDSGTTTFKAEVSGSWHSPIDVEINAVPGSADHADFAFEPVRLTLVTGGPPGIVSGTVVGDLLPEGDETFSLVATIVSDGGSPPARVQGGTVTIVDDDQARAARLHVEGATVLEGDQGVTVVEARVRLEPTTATTVTVAYQTKDGTAAAGDGDYRATSGTLTFAPGEVMKTVALSIVGDTIWETDQTFMLVLSTPVGALLRTASTEIVIANDDPPARVTLDDADVSEGSAGNTQVAMTLRFDHPVPPSTKVHVIALPGSATAGSDFVSEFIVVYPEPGATSAPFSVTVVGDTRAECDEGILIEYNAFYTGDEVKKTARLLIQDDDGGPQGGLSCADPFLPGTQPPPDPPALSPADPSPDAGSGYDAPGVMPTLGRGIASSGGCALTGDPPSKAGAVLFILSLAAVLLPRCRRRRARH
jgi:hypothetical protein